MDEKELVERALERAKLLDSLDFIPDDTGERGASTAAGGSNDETENRTAAGGSDAENVNKAAAVGNHDGDEAVTADQNPEKGQRNPEKGQRNPANGQKNPWKGMLLHLEYSARKKLRVTRAASHPNASSL